MHSFQCPDCGEIAVGRVQKPAETRKETCQCPNGHAWKRRLLPSRG